MAGTIPVPALFQPRNLQHLRLIACTRLRNRSDARVQPARLGRETRFRSVRAARWRRSGRRQWTWLFRCVVTIAGIRRVMGTASSRTEVIGGWLTTVEVIWKGL